MATDPVSAFLTGFRAVDQYETNKQRRAFMDEQMSWNRKLWGEQEKQWARDELDRYRTEKFAQFEARVQDVVNSVPKEEVDKWFSNEDMKDGEITGFSRVTNQVLKEMIAEDPEFGEHIAQAFGVDPRAGGLVKNKLHPVHSVGVHPEQGVWFQVNSVNGPQPLTKFRTSQGNDPVYFGRAGLKELVKIFGPNATNSQLAITQQLHRALGIERDGSPVDTPRTQGQPSGGAAAGTNNDIIEGTAEDVTPPGGTTTSTDVHPSAYNTFITDEERTTLSRDEQYRLAEERRQQQIDQNQTSDAAPPVADNDYDMDIVGEGPGGYPVVRKRPGGVVGRDKRGNPIIRNNEESRGYTAEAQDRLVDVLKAEEEYGPDKLDATNAADQVRMGVGAAVDVAVTGIGNATDDLVGFIQDKSKPLREFTGTLFTGVSSDKAITESVNKPSQVPADKRKENAPSNMQTQEQVDTAIANGDTLNTAAAVQNAAKVVTRNKRPGFVELYNAVGLARLKIISPEQLLNYSQTGQFNAGTKATLQNVGNGTIAVYDALGNLMRVDKFNAGGDGQPSVQDQRRAYDLLKARTDLLYEDHPEAQANFISSLEEAYNYLGLPSDNSEQLADRANPTNLNLLQNGAQLLRRFDEDQIQLFDLPCYDRT
jgi:hypothetical protein